MIVCGTCVVLTILYSMFINVAPPGWEKKNLVKLLFAVEIVGLLISGFELWQEKTTDGSVVVRNEAGNGVHIESRTFSVADTHNRYEMEIIVPEKKLTEEEAYKILDCAQREIDECFLGNNVSIDRIEENVVISDVYVDGLVDAVWMFDNDERISAKGEIDNILLESPEMIEASVLLACEDYQTIYNFSFVIVPKELSDRERIIANIRKDLEQILDNKSTDREIKLPIYVDNEEITWKVKTQRIGIKLTLLGLFAIFAIGYGRVIDERKKIEERNENLKLQYSEIVSTISILLESGMSIRKIWERMTNAYKDMHGKQVEAYEEMQTSLYQMQSGMSEAAAIEQFGIRCQVQSYKKLSGILLQYLQKGSRDVGKYLNDEVHLAFEERKTLAKIQGEKASTRLLIPMILLLAVVLVIILVPALMSFSI